MPQIKNKTDTARYTNRYEIMSRNGEITIPFELYRNDIRMRALINERECYVLLDNGSLWDELLFFGSPKVDSLKLNITGETILGDPNVENPNRVDMAENISVYFKDIVFHGQDGIITRYIPGTPNIWEGADCQISAAFFKNFVVSIDFDRSVINLIPPEKFKDTDSGQEIIMKEGPFNSRTITCHITPDHGREFPLEVLVDLGGLYPLYLPLGRDDRISLPENAKAAVLGQGFGQVSGYLGTVKSVRLGKYSLQNVVTAFTPVTGDASIYGNTMIGLPLLQQFHRIIFDYRNNRIIIEPKDAVTTLPTEQET